MKYEETTDVYGDRVVEYSLLHSYAAYTPACNSCETTRPTVVIFEWQSSLYSSTQEVISTTAFNAIGSLCGILITLMKAFSASSVVNNNGTIFMLESSHSTSLKQ